MKEEILLKEFDAFYFEIYKDRWEDLKKAFLGEKKYIKIPNLNKDFFIDEASYLVANILEFKDGDKILDCCSAPGGKILALINKLNNTNEVICNEYSKSRRLRLKLNIYEFIPKNKRGIIKNITGFNASKIGLFQKDKYDKILLDVPCSSERHIVVDKKIENHWSKTKSKRMHIQSHSMLQSSLMSLKTGGNIIYSTCSISTLENDGVIEKTFLKNKFPFKIIRFDNIPNYVEMTDYGYQIFPDKSEGRGPIYFSVIEKINY